MSATKLAYRVNDLVVDELRAIPLFSSLGDEALTALRGRLRLRRYRKGELVMREGALGDSMFIIRSGQVQVLRGGLHGTPETLVTHLGPGTLVGELAPLLDACRSATVRVVIDADLWELGKEELQDLFEMFPSIGWSISRELARRVTRTTSQPRETDEINLMAVLGSGALELADNLARVTGERVLLLDLGGLAASSECANPQVTLEPMDAHAEPDTLVARLSEVVDHFSRILMAIPREESGLTRKAAEQAELIIELGGRPTPWVKRFTRNGNYWPYPILQNSIPKLARRIARKRVGLALSSGNARSIAHIGVLQVLEREGIAIDLMSGTSGGGLFGGLYAIGKSVEEVAAFARGLKARWGVRGGLVDFNFPPRTGVVRGKKVVDFLNQAFDNKTFEEAEIPLRLIAADVITGEEVLLNAGSIAQAVRATISIVPLFDPVLYHGRYLIDGAAVNPVPTSALRGEVDIVIASSVIVSLEERIHRKVMKESGRLPNFVSLQLGKEEIMEAGIIQNKLGHVDALIQPNVTHFEGLDFQRADEFIRAGAEAAEAVVATIKSVLEPQPRRQFR